jgi:hypothetical protein
MKKGTLTEIKAPIAGLYYTLFLTFILLSLVEMML